MTIVEIDLFCEDCGVDTSLVIELDDARAVRLEWWMVAQGFVFS